MGLMIIFLVAATTATTGILCSLIEGAVALNINHFYGLMLLGMNALVKWKWRSRGCVCEGECRSVRFGFVSSFRNAFCRFL